MNKSKLKTFKIQLHAPTEKFMLVTILAVMLLTACAQSNVQPTTPSNPATQPAATPVSPGGDFDKAVSAAKATLAKKQNLNSDSIQLVDVQLVSWPDGCLGVQQPGIMCAMHVVDGYRIMLSANGQTYEVRSNLDGSQTVIVPGQSSSLPILNTRSEGLRITGVSSSIGSESGNPDQQVISYNVTIDNPGGNTITLLWLEPVLQDSLSGRAAGPGLRHAVNEVIGPNSQVDIHGQVTLNTNGLTKSSITQSGSLFSGITISTNQTIPIP